jgi:hypothetical protein
MINTALRRLAALAMATLAFPLACVAFLKGLPPLFLPAGYRPESPIWLWIWSWMPPVHFEVRPKSWTDYASSAFGFIALALVGIGLRIATQTRKTKPTRRWEDEP